MPGRALIASLGVTLVMGACGEAGPASDLDAAPGLDSRADAALGPDAATPDRLASERTRLLKTMAGADVCATWSALRPDERSVFLTLSHRLFVSTMADQRSMLEHMRSLYLIRGGGVDGTECGGIENNRLFLSMDDELWQAMRSATAGLSSVGDGAEGLWQASTDLAGPHAPFDESAETETGLRCALLLELASSRPPTAQLHFFASGSEVPIVRGDTIDLPADPWMVEIDHDFDCLHRSNPTCAGRQWESDYAENYGDYLPLWQPAGCDAR